MQGVHKCLAGCGKIITWRFALCSDCEKIYGSSPYQWPAWLRYLWRDTLRERRQNAKQQRYELNVDLSTLREVTNGQTQKHKPAA